MRGPTGTALIALEVLSVFLLIGAISIGIRNRTNPPRGGKIRFVRAAVLIPYVAGGLALNHYVFSSLIAYATIGAVWGLSFPARVLMYRKLVGGYPKTPWSNLFPGEAWKYTATLTIFHAVLWPISAPFMYHWSDDEANTMSGHFK